MPSLPDQLTVKKALEKHFKDSTELFPDFTSVKRIAVIPSGSTVVDAITGIGGFPRGRVTEVFGPESSGKTTFAIMAAIACQRAGGIPLFQDFEHAFDARYAHGLGLNLDSGKFIFSQPETFEQGARIADEFVERDLIDMLVFDSAAAMTPKDEMEGEADGSVRLGLQAQLMSKMLARLTKKIPRGRKPALILLNQTRMKIDVNNTRKTGEFSAGGQAIKFYSSIRIQLDIIAPEGTEARKAKGVEQLYTQNRTRITCIKNKLAPPWSRAQLIMEYGKGINNLASIAELAEDSLKIMSGAGFYKYTGDTPGTTFSCRGREVFLDMLVKNAALRAEIETKVINVIKQDQLKGLGTVITTTQEDAKEVEEAIILDDPTEVVKGLVKTGEGLPSVELD